MPLAIDFDALSLLLPHVGQLESLCQELYKHRGQISVNYDWIKSVRKILSLEPQEGSDSAEADNIAEKALVSLIALINVIGLNPNANPLNLLPAQFQSSKSTATDILPLVKLIHSVIKGHASSNVEKLKSPSAVPRMRSVECKPLLNDGKKQCLITLTNENPTTEQLSTHQISIDYETLDSLTKTMSKIRSQLFSVANK